MLTMTIELRSYQSRAIESLRAERRRGHQRILLVCPTGGGKTAVACAMIARALGAGLRVLVIAHRKELLDQFYGHLLVHYGITAGLMRADDERTDPIAPVQLASIATIARFACISENVGGRMRELPDADLIIVDEAHRAVSGSYIKVLDAYPDVDVIGLTATPVRLDGKPLGGESPTGGRFQAMVQAASYSELIAQGHIVAPIVYAPERAPDLSKVKVVRGDYDEGELESAMVHVVGDVVQEWKEKADGRATVVFAVGVAHSHDLADAFRMAGVRVAHLDSATPELERERILVDLELGRLDVVCNVGVLTEGWDQPRVKCCVMARPTLSLTLHMQTAGRILRPWGDKPPVLLDHAGNVERHGLPHEDRTWSLTGGSIRTQSKLTHHVCGGCFAYVEDFPCPLCGYAAPRKAREVRQAPGSLRLVGGAPSPYSDPREAFFWARVTEASRKGYQPGYAGAKFKEKYGTWPPWDWSQRAKGMVDDEWREAIRKTTERREFWQGRQAARASGMVPEHGFTAEPEED